MIPRLLPDEIEVTPFDLDDESGLPMEKAETWLSSEERDRAQRFHFAIHRTRFTRGRAMLRHVLASHLGTDPAELIFQTEERGKPYLQGEPIHFNLSHSLDRAVIAVSRLPSIGIDIECFDRNVDIDGLSVRCFLDREISTMCGLRYDEKQRAFFWLWTAKEARMKATGEGFSLGPRSIEISVVNGFPGSCLEPASPKAFIAPVILPQGDVACSLVSLSPFVVKVAEIPIVGQGGGKVP